MLMKGLELIHLENFTSVSVIQATVSSLLTNINMFGLISSDMHSHILFAVQVMCCLH